MKDKLIDNQNSNRIKILTYEKFDVWKSDTEYISISKKGLIQSQIDFKSLQSKLYYQIFIKEFIKEKKKNRLLLFGLNLGSLPVSLYQNYASEIETITNIEIDSDAIDVFNHLFGYLNIPVKNIHCCLTSFLSDRNEKKMFDIIIDDSMYVKYNNKIYDFSLVNEILNSGGIFIVNIHYYENFKIVISALSKFFIDFEVIPNTFIIICTKL